ncbi:hypothetical protein FG93_00081 [Bosea sp. LC85]|uniref:hypothetical protein n=1 Tax=Bosea sp. LC85 TaxID=1502851 RepID=UPI0004E37097|nr:hypothetical protein [Bosea sp. LC85]KFC75941.1 hypothetical protein FG93_00081 [Bosea sp. LC85]
MAVIDVIPFGERQFLIRLFPVSTIPDHIGFGRYYETACEIALKDGRAIRHECVVLRPNWRTLDGARIADLTVLLHKTDLTQSELSGAVISVARYGAELSEQEATARRNQA